MIRAGAPLAAACVLAAPAASATGREMGALGGVVFLMALSLA